MADEQATRSGETGKVHANEPGRKAGEKPAAGKGNWIEKHKALAYGGMALILIVLFLFLKGGGSASATTAADTAAQNGIDPATGYLNGSPADIASLGGGSGTSASVPGNTSTTTTTNTTNNYGVPKPAPKPAPKVGPNGSWTDTGQKWTLGQLAAKLGVPVSSFKGTNRLGQKETANPKQQIAKGAQFTFKTGA